MKLRPHDQHCAECDEAEFAGITYEATHEPKRSVCPDCDGGWTFDFALGRVYCRRCEAAKQGHI